jgi:hypothetical protein
VLDAFSDARVAELQWLEAEMFGSKRIYSSDFAMPILLSARGYTYVPAALALEAVLAQGVMEEHACCDKQHASTPFHQISRVVLHASTAC